MIEKGFSVIKVIDGLYIHHSREPVRGFREPGEWGPIHEYGLVSRTRRACNACFFLVQLAYYHLKLWTCKRHTTFFDWPQEHITIMKWKEWLCLGVSNWWKYQANAFITSTLLWMNAYTLNKKSLNGQGKSMFMVLQKKFLVQWRSFNDFAATVFFWVIPCNSHRKRKKAQWLSVLLGDSKKILECIYTVLSHH